MQLNHLNLTVTNAVEARDFLAKYFGMKPHEDLGDNPAFQMLRDEAGMVLTLMRAKRDTAVEYPGFFHIGFCQPTEEKVNEINRRLKEDGFDVPAPDRLHGSWTFYIQAPGGFVVEVLG